MRKFLPTLLALFLFPSIFAQDKAEIKGITTKGIVGVKKSLSPVIEFGISHPIPSNFKPYLRPELEGPQPKGQNPAAKPVSRFGTLVNKDVTTNTTVAATPTQSVYSNFLTIWGNYGTAIAGRESPYTPPDNCGDVGTTQIVATANCRLKAFTKPSVTGTASTTTTGSGTTTLAAAVDIDLNVFFTNTSLGINSISDPHVRFDRLTNRWFVVAIDVNHTTNNYCMVAVSDGPTIATSSSFTIYYFSVGGTGGSTTDFFDYPTLGVDKNSLYIGGNMFANGKTFSGSNLWVLNKASLIGGTLNLTSFPHSITSTDMYTPQGVHNDDPGATSGFFVGASQTVFSKLVIRRVSYSGSAPTLSSDLNLTTSTTYSPKTVPTQGGIAIDGNDRRLCAAMIKKNKITGTTNLWVAQGTLLNSSGIGGSTGDRDGALWLEIGNLATTPSVVQAATLYDGTNPTSSAIYYTYPTIALSGQGHNLMGFTSAGPTQYAQAAAAGRYRTDAAGTFQAPTNFTNTTSSYSPGANRWGDFTQTVVDPEDDMTMWTFTEYAPTTNAWGVRAGQFKAPAPAAPTVASIPACGATTTITINGASTNNTEFFDAGPDAGGPGFKHIGVSVSPATITVSNVVFVSPTQINADFNVPQNAAAGPYTVTVTNPDGQTSSTTFSLSCSGVICGAPTALASSSITSTSATVSWTAPASGAVNYAVDYSPAGQNTWTSVAAATTSTSVAISGLTASTGYDWRVKTNCSSSSSSYVQASFTTSSATVTCNPPTNLNSSAITSSGATVSWTAGTGAVNYNVQYQVTGSGSWATVNTSATSLAITGLSASTSYDWQVQTVCPSASTSYVAGTSFTTLAATCSDQYEPNNTSATAAAISTGTAVSAAINPSGDIDFYSFSTSAGQKNVQVTLTKSSALNYALTLFDNSGKQLATSSSGDPVTVVYNNRKRGNYIVKVAGVGGASSATDCYSLQVNTGSGTFTANIINEANNTNVKAGGLKLYPVPTTSAVNISFDAVEIGSANVIIVNELGQQVLSKKITVGTGTNFNTIDVSSLKSGVYTLKLNNGKEIQTQKMVISK
ncbi:MAG: fibronectin type III domain-containing protein [Bacteroidota bacterium]|nr:fibronectin type III domain-containing protein [Bacteroidota bacterium]